MVNISYPVKNLKIVEFVITSRISACLGKRHIIELTQTKVFSCCFVIYVCFII
jgi:hypothetical protein